MTEQDRLNYNMYNGAVHLFEAGRYFSNIDEDEGIKYLKQSQSILETITLPEEKISDSDVFDIMDKIMSFDCDDISSLKEMDLKISIDNE